MEPPAESIAVIEGWFRGAFPGAVVEPHIVSDRMVVLFRAYEPRPGARRHELEVSFEAFEDHEPATIAADLTRLSVRELLTAEPARRPLYNRHRRIVDSPQLGR